MLISFDRTNFPLIVVEKAAVEVQLLPVTKLQFEQFVTESGMQHQAHYQEMLALNPGIPHDRFRADERERLFVTGILPQEAGAFAEWLGEGFDLPTVEEWRAIYGALRVMSSPQRDLATDLVEGPAGLILEEFSKQFRVRAMLDFTLMKGGLVEWVQRGQSWVGLGAPRPQFHPNLWDPLNNEIIPIRLDVRVPYFGFRLVRREEWYLADQGHAKYIF